jgi:hypothetical protein
MSDVERESMVEKAAKSNQASLDILVRGAEKTFDNAERLFREAEILAKGGALALPASDLAGGMLKGQQPRRLGGQSGSWF